MAEILDQLQFEASLLALSASLEAAREDPAELDSAVAAEHLRDLARRVSAEHRA